jgi:hypothetical protein
MTFTPLPTLTVTPFPVTLTDTPTHTPSPTRQTCDPPEGWQIYVVQPGDNLFELSVEFQTSILTLRLGNCLSSLELTAGQILYVPPSNGAGGSSVVPPEGCDDPKIGITSPVAGETVTDGWEMVGVADPPDFGFYRVQVRRDVSGQVYETRFEDDQRVAEGNRIGFLNFADDDVDGFYWVRLSVYDSDAQIAGHCAMRVFFDVE